MIKKGGDLNSQPSRLFENEIKNEYKGKEKEKMRHGGEGAHSGEGGVKLYRGARWGGGGQAYKCVVQKRRGGRSAEMPHLQLYCTIRKQQQKQGGGENCRDVTPKNVGYCTFKKANVNK